MPAARLTANTSRLGVGNPPAALNSPQRTGSPTKILFLLYK